MEQRDRGHRCPAHQVGEDAGASKAEAVHDRTTEQARRHAARLDKHASPNQLASPHAVELYRRNFLELLRIGKPGSEAYYLSRLIGPVDDADFGEALESVGRTGCPRGRPAYVVERAAIRILDLPGGMILTLLALFASLFAFAWASKGLWGGAGAGTVFLVATGLVVAVGLMLVSAAVVVAAVRSMNK